VEVDGSFKRNCIHVIISTFCYSGNLSSRIPECSSSILIVNVIIKLLMNFDNETFMGYDLNMYVSILDTVPVI